MSPNLSLVRRVSERQQARIRAENARRMAFEDALDQGHIGRIEAKAGEVRHYTEPEWAAEQERRAVEEQINRNNLTKKFL